MSHFYAEIEGSRGAATRQGTKKSGMYGHVRGWRIGGKVVCFVDNIDPDGGDCVRIDLTGGSNNSSSILSLGTFKLDKDGNPVKVMH